MNIPSLDRDYDKARIVFMIGAYAITILAYITMLFVGSIHSVWGIYAGLTFIFKVLLCIFYEITIKESESDE